MEKQDKNWVKEMLKDKERLQREEEKLNRYLKIKRILLRGGTKLRDIAIIMEISEFEVVCLEKEAKSQEKRRLEEIEILQRVQRVGMATDNGYNKVVSLERQKKRKNIFAGDIKGDSNINYEKLIKFREENRLSKKYD